jgi:hypothetical protein
MTMLLPCTNCRRHVLHTEAECPFCATSLDFSQAAEPALPTRRLGRAATFAFGATMVSATALASCGGESDDGEGSAGMPNVAGMSNVAGLTAVGGAAVYGAPPVGGSASGGNGGVANGGNAASGGFNVQPVYGIPAPGGSGGGESGGTGGTAGASGAGGEGGAGGADFGGLPGPVYGAPP